jgi:hypothetical protein
MDSLTAAQDAAVQMIDTSIVRVHQLCACIANTSGQHIGRSRGGLTSQIHVVVNGNGLPVQLGLTGVRRTTTGSQATNGSALFMWCLITPSNHHRRAYSYSHVLADEVTQ